MRTKFFIFTSILVLLVAFALTVNAHPGDTDSSGGHYDRSTGEYHYHHGYSAHSHRDMDGDGDLDCPYNFVDKTGQNSSNSSGDSHSSSGKQPSTKSDPTHSWMDDFVVFFSSPYGMFCIVAVILQIIFVFILIFAKLKSKHLWTLLLSTVILFIASIKISGPLIIACSLILCILPMLSLFSFMLYTFIKWLVDLLFRTNKKRE